ncbi:protein EMSY [Clonorchis sinensis]|uniref:Protein EMSY n=1 Tax=Clonorchis sinensis TaxID=79923 RepID=G7Y9W2_CLOSI|nr:protein EMSY [Clonorchis sinensis]
MSRVEQAAKDYGPIWPMLLDYSRRECYQILRRLELEAYGRIVAVFRAQGALTNEKRKVLHKLQGFFGISTERHKAEVRRVVNDEELATISETLCGKEATDDWISEGKRIVPILHRPSPETAYLDVANKASQEHSTLNSGLPHPSDTALSELQLGRIRKNYRLFDLSQTKVPSSKTVTYDKATETTRSLQGSPAHVQMDIDESISGLVPRVEYEVTCETDSAGPVYLQAGILNGHVQSAVPVHGQSVSLRTQKELSRGDNANHQLTGAVLPRSPQEVTSYCTVDKDINSYKPVDLVSTSPAKPGALPLAVINAHSPRKRCFSATVPYETPTTWSAVNVVYTPATAATPTNRRTSYSHLTGTVTSPPDNQRIPSSTGGTGTLRVAQPTVGSGQLIQTPGLGKAIPHTSTIATPPGTHQVTRPQTPLVMQVHRYFRGGSWVHGALPSYIGLWVVTTQSLLGRVSTPNRIQGVNTVFIPSPDSSRVVPTSPFPKHSTPLVTVPTNQLLAGPPKSDQLSDVPTSQMTKRLVYPPNTSMFVPSTSSTSVSGSSHNITSNNIVVFQRTANRNIALPAAAALKVGTSVSSMQPAGNNVASSGSVPSSTGSRQLRILGVSTVSPSHPLSFTAPTAAESLSTSDTPADSERKAELSVTSQSEDFIPSLLARASRLGAMLDVDLDADEVPPEPQSDADVPQCVASTGDFPQTDGMDSESCWTQLNRDAYYAESNSPSSVNASCATPETSNSVELLPESTAGLKGGQLWAILGLSSHPTTLRHPEEPAEFAAAESEKPTAHEKWDQAQLPDYNSDDLSSEAPEPKRLRLSSSLNPAVHSDCKGLLDNPNIFYSWITRIFSADAKTEFFGGRQPKAIFGPSRFINYRERLQLKIAFISGDSTSKWQTLEDLLTYLKQIASSFVHCAASDEPEPHTLKKSFAPDSHLLDALRTVRQLGASVCTLGEERGETTEALTLTLTTVTNFLDALLLVLFQGKQVSLHWLSVDASVQSSAALALSISLQCLSNTLAAFQTLDIAYPSTTLMSLLAVVLSGSRTRLLLTQTVLYSFLSVTEQQRHRIISYSSYLLYCLLRAFHPVGLSDSAKNLVCSKLIHEPLVFSSLCHISSHVQVTEDGLLRDTRLHVQLLLHQVADTLGNCPCREFGRRNSSISLDDVIQSTGIVLWLRQRAAQAEFQQSQTNGDRIASLPHTLPACLLFWHAFLQETDQTAATMGVTLDSLSQKLKLSYDSWFQALTTADISADDPQDHEFPYAQLRGLVHVLAEAIFSKTCYAVPLNGGSTPAESQQASCETLLPCFSQGSDAFQSFMAGQGVQLWDCLCDLLVVLSVTTKHLEVHFAASNSRLDQHPVGTVEGSKCTVYPSRIAKVLPTIHPTSAFSLCQAVGFQQDCIRCLTGLLHHNPKLSISLASHRVNKFPLCLPENACTAAFEALLDATNKQPENPFAPEWAVLAIRLALKPNTKDPTALEGARLLAKRLGDLKLIR